ncbi:MAG: hypothetical protein ACLPXB_00235 [Thiobacillaceae bacterium]
MVAIQNRFTMSAELFLVVMLARETARAQAAGSDVERSAGTEEDRLNSFAARPVREVREWRTHRSTLRSAPVRPAFRVTSQSPDFSIESTSLPKKARWDRL